MYLQPFACEDPYAGMTFKTFNNLYGPTINLLERCQSTAVDATLLPLIG